MMDLRRALALRFADLSSKVMRWDMLWFAQRYLDIAEALTDQARVMSNAAIVKLSQFATDQEEGVEKMTLYEGANGLDLAKLLAQDIDTRNRKRYGGRVAYTAERATETPAPQLPQDPPQLLPKGGSAAREAAELAKDLGAWTGQGGDA